jgi:hypothetical protein
VCPTRTWAEVLGRHTAVIWLEGVAGRDLRARHPGEEFRCHYVRELNEVLKETS